MAAASRLCVIFLVGHVEHRSAWYSSTDRAQRALTILRKRYGAGNAILYRD